MELKPIATSNPLFAEFGKYAYTPKGPKIPKLPIDLNPISRWIKDLEGFSQGDLIQ